ncbi:MAG: HAD family hydrolase [Chloroflexi bacterium]|nr:HAD family hydrolase [Chloroflexota bacterium]
MKYRAVIFDLYGTLVDELRYPYRQEVKYQRMMSEVATTLGVRIDEFKQAWFDPSRRKIEGELRPMSANLAYLCDEVDVEVSTEQLERAVAVRLEHIRRALRPRDGVLEALSGLRDAGVKTGLVSSCNSDTSDLWSSTPFAALLDASILSCEVGMRKPDPGIYRLACERLTVEPQECLFVGDGGSNELTGASNVGMDAVCIRAPDDTISGDREDWRGVRISSVAEVFDQLE